MGISKRIRVVPKGFKVGEHWVFLAHPKTILVHDNVTDEAIWSPGVFRIFKPTAIEKIVTQSQYEDAEAMERLVKQGVTPVPVPDNDRDHQGSVYDREETMEMTL